MGKEEKTLNLEPNQLKFLLPMTQMFLVRSCADVESTWESIRVVLCGTELVLSSASFQSGRFGSCQTLRFNSKMLLGTEKNSGPYEEQGRECA